MKSKILLACLAVAITCSNAAGQIRSNKDLIGKWTASSLRLEFIPDGRLLLTMRGGSMPGARYRTDFMNNPAQLHIEVQNKSEKIIYKSKLEFITDDSFRLTSLDLDAAHSFDKTRSVILRRVK